MASANDLLTDGSRSKGGDLERTTTPTTNGSPCYLKMIKNLMQDIVILLRGRVTVVGRLSVLMSGIFCDCKKNVVFGCIGDFVAKIRYCIII